jgi:hemerythrin superfamily protein
VAPGLLHADLQVDPFRRRRTVNAIKLLQQQHREVEQLFQQFESAEEGAPSEKKQIFLQIADALAAHATIEERVFYPSVREDQTEDLLQESVQEHLEIKRLIAELLELEPRNRQFSQKVMRLQAEVMHHVGEEENELFPKVRKLFEREAMEDLGIEMENLMAELMAETGGQPSKRVPAETQAPAQL